jgi:hypothetical protein
MVAPICAAVVLPSLQGKGGVRETLNHKQLIVNLFYATLHIPPLFILSTDDLPCLSKFPVHDLSFLVSRHTITPN